jgi:hypothetical protein
MLRPLAGLECAPRDAAGRECCDEVGTACHEQGEQMTCCTGGPPSPDVPGATPAALHKGARELTELAVLSREMATLAPVVHPSPHRGRDRVATTAASPPLVALRL